MISAIRHDFRNKLTNDVSVNLRIGKIYHSIKRRLYFIPTYIRILYCIFSCKHTLIFFREF